MKNKNRDYLVSGIVIAVLIIAIVLISVFPKQENNDVIKIGIIDSFSGEGSIYGEWTRKNMVIAAEEINERGGLKGKKLVLVFEDHHASPQEAVSAYQKLKLEGIDIIDIGFSSPSLAVSPLANGDKKILFTHGATTPLYSTKDDYTFRTSINANQFAEEEASFLFDGLNKRKVAVIHINNDFGLGMKNVFVKSFNNLGGEVLITENFEQGSKDFKSLITKVQAVKPEAVFLVGHMTGSGLLVKQMKELGFNPLIISDVYSVEGEEFLKQAEESGEGIIYVAPYFDKNKKPEFSKKYLERYGEEPTYYSQAYDVLLLIEEALKGCKTIHPDCIKDELFKIKNFEGASGTLTFDEYGDVQKPIEFKTIKDRKFVKYEK